VKAVRTYTVRPYLPENLERLRDISCNLWWCWHPDAIELLRRIDRRVWEDVGHNPITLLANVSQDRLNQLAADQSFLDHLDRVSAAAEDYLSEATWFQRTSPGLRDCLVGYFSLEFGLSEALPVYSGGLGVLAGDHLKSASDLGLPVVGVGLLYQEGYFRQYLNQDGWQQEDYPNNDFYLLPLQPMLDHLGRPLRIEVPCLGEQAIVQIWKVLVGRVPLLMLDTNLPDNSPRIQEITRTLYGGDTDMRIRQEIVLGIGGVRAFQATPYSPVVFHMNEGHAGFLSLERIRVLMEREHLTFDEAREATSVSNVFTTHTPVPAGHDRFDAPLMLRHFEGYYQQLGLTEDQFLGLGREDPADKTSTFCMTVLALRLSEWRNGVSRLHGTVSRKLWKHLWPDVPEEEVPIGSVTNGIHTPSWISHDLRSLFDRYLGRRWLQEPADASVWKSGEHIPDTELWRTHERRRERLVAFARERLRRQLERRRTPTAEIAQADEALDPEALTIGFARRFATYKRATLLLRDMDRLIRILCDKQRPVQIIFAGKAHPKDSPGKELIRDIVHAARKPELRNRIVFLEDYDMTLARHMVQGCDVWMNTPRRPLEASGTSGMKAGVNGAINCSTLDGWWVEGYAPDTGFVIGNGEEYEDTDDQDEVESRALFDILEKEIIPLYYERAADGLPRKWIELMRSSMGAICPAFNSNRMVKEYAEEYYLPGVRWWRSLSDGAFQRARDLAAWRKKVRDSWTGVRIESILDDCESAAEVGDQFGVRAVVHLGVLRPSDVRVQLFYGDSDTHGALTDSKTIEMVCNDPTAEAPFEYSGRVPCRNAGVQGYTVRVVPSHPDLVSPFSVCSPLWAGGEAYRRCAPEE
jgi:glycogen phosphorylase